MRITCTNVMNGWQTVVRTEDGQNWPFGPVFNRVSDLWDWQRKNLYNCVEGYVLMEVPE